MAARRPANAFDEKSPFPRIEACGLRAKRPARTVRVCRAAAKGAPRRRNGRNGRPATRLGALRHTNTPQSVTRRSSDSRTASRTNAPQPKWPRLIWDWRASAQPNSPQPGLTRRSQTHAPRSGAARRDSDCRAAARLGVPQFGWTRRSAGKKPAAFPLSPSPCRTFVLRRPARPRAAAFPRSERSALPCDRPRRFASTQAAVSDGAGHKRSFYKQAHKRPNRLCCLCLLSISPNLQREGPAAQPPQSFRAKSRKERQP